MANAYLDAYRSSGTKTAVSGGSLSSGSDNPYLSSYRTTQLPSVMDTFNKQKAAQQASQKLKAQQDADKKKQDEANSPLGFLKGIAGGVANFISQASKPVGQGGVNVVANASQSVEQALNQQKQQATKQIKAGQPLSTVIPASGIGLLDKLTGASDLAKKTGNALASIPAGSAAILAQNDKNISTKQKKTLVQDFQNNVKNTGISPDVISPKKGANPVSTTAKFAGEFAGAGASAAGFVVAPEAKPVVAAVEKTALSGVAKTVFDKVAQAASKKLGRDLTEQEATNLAEQTKKIIPESHVSETEAIPTKTEPTVKPAETPPTPEPHPMQEPIFTAAKTQAEKRLGRELTPAETTKLTTDTQNLVQEKFPVEPTPVAEKIPVETPVTTPKPAGDTTSGNSLRIQQKALEQKLDNNYGDLPQYKSINMKDQAEKAVDLVTNDKQKAIDIIDGKTTPPEGLHPQSVHQALEQVAIKEGDGQLLAKLAKSHINTELSEGAQKLRIAAERDPHSAVEQIRQVQDARQARRGSAKKVTADIGKKVDAATPKVKKEDWASFVESLKCKV